MTDAMSDYTGKWAQGPIVCAVCGHDWQAVFPVVCVSLECSGCGHMTDAPALPVRYDDHGMPIAEDRNLSDALEGVMLPPPLTEDDDG